MREEIETIIKTDSNFRELMTEWFLFNSEVVIELEAKGIPPHEAIKFLRSILVQRNLNLLDK